MKESHRNQLTVILTGCLYALSYFFRGSIAPITDVLETEFNATMSEIGLMSSLFWLSYCLVQIPIGILLQYMSTEKTINFILISSFSFFVSCTLFGVIGSNSIILPSIFMLSAGILAAPFWLCFMSLVTTKFSTNQLAIYSGSMMFVNCITLPSGNLFQAYLYQNYQLWRPVYLAISVATFITIVFFAVLNIKDLSSFNVIQSLNGYISYYAVAEYPEDQELDQFDDHSKRIKMYKPTKPLLSGKKNKLEIELENFSEITCNPQQHKKKESVCNKLKKSLLNKWNWLLSMHQYCINTIILAFNGLYLINYMTLKYGIDRELATMISGSFWISHAFGAVVIGKLASKFKKRKIFYLVTCFVVFVPPIYIIYGDEDSTPLIVLIACNILSGFGCGIVTVTFVLCREYNQECADIASGVLNTLSVTAGFIMNWLIGILMDFNFDRRNGQIEPVTEDRIYTADDYNFGFMVIPIVAAICIVLSFMTKETNGKSTQY